MIIAGNSHVSVFKNGCYLPDRPEEKASAHWVGALEIQHFFTNHPAARKVRSLFEAEAGWKFLCLGNHDTFRMLEAARTRPLEAVLDDFLGRYQQVFSELNARGRFGWLVGIQQTENLPVPGATPEQAFALSQRFNTMLSAWCQATGIPVIDPLPRILRADGTPDPALLMSDGLHLKPSAAPLYFEAIAQATGETVRTPSLPHGHLEFEPKTEPESFCALILAELGLSNRSAAGAPMSTQELQVRLLESVHERLEMRGLDLTLDADSDFVDSGLLDSLDLVETYTLAIELMGMDIPFEVDLRELNTVAKLAAYVLEQHAAANQPAISSEEPTLQDFIYSLRADFSHPEQRAEIVAAEARIAGLDADRLARLHEVLQTVTGGRFDYGVVHFWLALVEQRMGRLDRALDMLSLAGRVSFPTPAAKLSHYEAQWRQPASVLPDRRAFNLLLAVDVPTDLAPWLECYLASFSMSDDLALHIVAGEQLAEVEAVVRAVLEAKGLDPTAIPDISLLGLPRSRGTIESVAHEVDLVLGSGAWVGMARDLGLPALLNAEPHLLRAAEKSFPALDWKVPQLPIEADTRERWLLTATDWKPGILAFLQAVRPGEDVSLLVRVAPGKAAQTLMEVGAWLSEQGIDTEAMPEVLILDDATPCETSVYRSATAWLDTGEARDRAIASALGLAVLPLDRLVTPSSPYLVSAIVSTYKSERFMRQCLEDLEAQTIADRLEIIVIDSNSPQNERAIVEEFQQRYDNIRYIRTDEREGVYKAWNRGIEAATGKYVTNANTDDRHRPDALERMVEALEANPDVALVYGDVAVTTRENATFDNAPIVGHYRWPDFEPRSLFMACYVGPQPMWRRSLHDTYGYFDASFVTAGDYEFWLRLARHESMLHLPEVLGLYLYAESSVEHRSGDLSGQESEVARDRYWPKEWGPRPAPSGYFLVPYQAPRKALPEDGKTFKVLLYEVDSTRAERTLRTWLEAFSPDEAVTLYVVDGPASRAVVTALAPLIGSHRPDVQLIAFSGAEADLVAYVRETHLLVGAPEAAAFARSAARPAFVEPRPEWLRIARDRFRTMDWGTDPLPLEAPSQERWLLPTMDGWEATVAEYLRSFRAGLSISLLLRVAPGQAEAMQEALLTWLDAQGYEPDAMPDLVLLDNDLPSDVALYRAANAVVDTGHPEHAATAAALGLRTFRMPSKIAEPAGEGAPLVSVVVTCFNYGHHLREAVESVLAQTFRSWEVVIVDDGSTDETPEVAAKLQADYPRHAIRVIRQANSGKPALARNRGITESHGRYILCLDADDKLSPDFLEACVSVLEANPKVSIAYPEVQKYGESCKFEPHPAYSFEMLCRFNFITLTTVFRRQAWEDVGGFASHVGYEDWDFWISCGERGHFGQHVPVALSWYRIHTEGTYTKDRAKDQFIKAQVVNNHPKLYSSEQLDWAQGVLAGDRAALALDSGLGVVPQIPSGLLERRIAAATLSAPAAAGLHVLFTMYGWAEEGGGTILPRQIAKALVRRGHRVTVIYTPSQTRPDKPAYHVESGEEEGVQLFAIYNRPAIFYDMEHPEREADDPHMRRIIAQLVSEVRPDIVHYHSLLNFSTGIAAEIKQAGVPSIFTSHNYWPICPRMYLFQEDLTLCSGPSEDGSKCAVCLGRPDQTGGYAQRADSGRQMLNRWVDRHLAVSHRVKDLYAGSGHDASRIHVLQQQPETVEWLWEKAGSRRALEGVLARPLKVGFIGSLLPQKGVHVLVRALQSFSRDQIEGHLFGSGPKAYEDMLHEIDAKDLVKFHGRYDVQQLPELLKHVDVVVIPSIWEDCAPLVVAEALAARCPVVGSRIGGIPDFVDEGKTGFLVDPRNAPGLASALFQFVRDPGLLGRMQRNILAPRGFDAYLDELVGHYHDVVGQQGLRVVWEGSQFVRHSLALINREVCRRLAESVLELSIVPYEADEFGPEVDPSLQVIADRTYAPLTGPADVHVRHQWPPKFEAPAEGAWAMIQPWEFGGIPQEWVAPMTNQVDEIWVPTSHVRDGYLRSGIPADKVIVIPNGVDTDRLNPGASKYPLKTRKRFKFLFVGGTILRKGIDILLEAYEKAFSSTDDVCLVIKDLGGKSFYKGQTAKDRIAEIQANPLAPEIEYLDDPLTDAEIAGLYAACDCLVHPYRGEGFALPIAEAMATSLPVIVTGYGACLDFCDPETAYLIPAREVPLPPSSLPPSAIGYWWAEPDGDALVTLMQSVFANPEQAREVGKRARDRILSGFTWAHMAERINERLRFLGMRTPTRIAQADPFQAGLVPLPLEDRRRYAFFHHPQWSSTSWQEVVTSYARAYPADADVSLVLWLDPSQGVTAEEAGDRIAGALAEAGLDPENGPDLLLVPDALDLPGLARLYTAVDCIVPHGEERDTQRAGKVGKRTLDDLSVEGWHGAAALGQTVHG